MSPMSFSDSSPLSSPPSSDGDSFLDAQSKGIAKFFLKTGAITSAPTVDSPPEKKRPASPPHEYVLADNPDIPFIVMFRSRFHDVFPTALTSFGPQDLERGAVDPVPGEHIESLLCALLGLVLNRKKYVERAHYQRALEEAVVTHSSQWPRAWDGKNPLRGGNTFASMNPSERLFLIKTLIIWALSSSEAVQAVVKDSYKQVRHEDDLNQPLSVQPWGQDGLKRRYWLVEGRDDTEFRLYRESNAKLKHKEWWTVAGSIDELKFVSTRLDEDGSQAARRLSERITLAIPRFEATQDRRKRREYRLARKAQFVKPEPGFSLYEGRTRGKKIRYTFSSEDEEDSDRMPTRRSNGQSGKRSPAEEASGPVFTASGRQIKPRHGGMYGESKLSGQDSGIATPAVSMVEAGEAVGEQTELAVRPRRTGLRQPLSNWNGGGDHIPGYNVVDQMEDEEEAASSGADEYFGDDGNGNANDTAAEDMSNDASDVDDMDGSPGRGRSLVVQLRYSKEAQPARMEQRIPQAIPVVEAELGLNGNGHQPHQSDEAHSTLEPIGQAFPVKAFPAGLQPVALPSASL